MLQRRKKQRAPCAPHPLPPSNSTVAPENVLIGLDDSARLGHLTYALDQHAERPSSRLGLLDYMAPEMMAARSGAERDLALAGVLRSGTRRADGDGCSRSRSRSRSVSDDGVGAERVEGESAAADTVRRITRGGWGNEAADSGTGDEGDEPPLEPGSAAAMAAAARRTAAAEGLARAQPRPWSALPAAGGAFPCTAACALGVLSNTANGWALLRASRAM